MFTVEADDDFASRNNECGCGQKLLLISFRHCLLPVQEVPVREAERILAVRPRAAEAEIVRARRRTISDLLQIKRQSPRISAGADGRDQDGVPCLARRAGCGWKSPRSASQRKNAPVTRPSRPARTPLPLLRKRHGGVPLVPHDTIAGDITVKIGSQAGFEVRTSDVYRESGDHSSPSVNKGFLTTSLADTDCRRARGRCQLRWTGSAVGPLVFVMEFRQSRKHIDG